MSTILDKIIATKRQEIVEAKKQQTLNDLEQQIKSQANCRGFTNALKNRIQQQSPAVIAEIKKASPSKGVIRVDFKPDEHAVDYAKNGATCLSVLTDSDYFQGSTEHLKQVRQACSLPVIRKDFMIDGYQIMQSRAMGADCVLLILAALDDQQAKELYDAAVGLGMDVLVEAHSLIEIERALRLTPMLLGINNRNLKTFKVDLDTTLIGKKIVPDSVPLFTESGIKTRADVQQMTAAGIYGFLVGEYFMRQAEPGLALKELFF